ncbi:MAG: hypothetical protein NT062_31515 [Proteobacteria bacterium]|nr:hypothetical protein [Pseudomonadota bacterium]
MRAMLVFLIGCSAPRPIAPASPVAPKPTPQVTAVTLVELVVGATEACVRRSDDAVWCWSLATATTPHPGPPVEAVVARGARHLVAMAHGTCAVFAAGMLRCWGEEPAPVPAPLARLLGDAKVRLVAVAPGLACVTLASGHARCAGADGAFAVPELDDVLELVADDDEVCGRSRAGMIRCVGTPARAPIIRVTEAVSLGLGRTHGCVAQATGRVRCWGTNTQRQLGLPGGGVLARAVEVPGIVDATSVAASATETCVVHRDRHVSCWGGGPDDAAATPRTLVGVTDATSLALGATSGCALAAHAVTCWRDAHEPPTIVSIPH